MNKSPSEHKFNHAFSFNSLPNVPTTDTRGIISNKENIFNQKPQQTTSKAIRNKSPTAEIIRAYKLEQQKLQELDHWDIP